MKLKLSFLVLVLLSACVNIEARHRQRGGKDQSSVHHRSKRTIGDIINWKLNLIQNILGGLGLGGLFGGGKPSRPSYGPPRPSRPRPQRPPSYNNRPQGPRAPLRPNGPSRPNSRPQFGPSNAIKMLPAPNLATGRPPVSGGSDVNLGSPVLDTVTSGGGSPASPVQQTNTDSYGSPQGPVIQQPRAPASVSSNSYSAPQSSFPAPAPQQSSYSAPSGSFSQPSSSSLPSLPTQYGSGATNTFSPGGPIITDNSAPFSPSQPAPASVTYNNNPAPASAPDSYGGAIAPVLAPRAPAPAADSYGGAIAPVLAPAVTVTTARSFTVEYDDYDPNDVPADQAAPLPSYGISSTPDTLDTYGVASNSALADDYDPNDVPPDQAGDPLPGYDSDVQDVYGSAVAPVGTSAPVPDDVFTSDAGAQTSYDTYNPGVIDLTDNDNAIEDIEDNSVIDLRKGSDSSSDSLSDSASLLPPVEDEEEFGLDFEDDLDTVTPTSAPVLFTYAPSEGSTAAPDLSPQVNIVVQNDGGSLSDPLNVIPDEYEEDYDQDLSSYGNDLYDDAPASPAFEDLRGIEFTTEAELPALDDPEPTTYRAPIDFDLGTTASSGIDVGEVFTSLEGDDDALADAVTEASYDDDYETEDETDYTPQNERIPIVLDDNSLNDTEESLPSYDPVPVLLVGTPEKSESSLSQVEEELPLYENALDARVQSKRKAGSGKSKLRELYNNWYGARNDWSRKIAKVQGRIRSLKKLSQQSS